MKLNLVSKKVHRASLEAIQGEPPKKKNKANVTISNEIYGNAKDPNLVRIRYAVAVIIDNVTKLDIDYDFDFKTDSEITSEFANSIEVRSSAPSLAYPYIKSYAEQLISLSGLGYYNLPYFDFISDPFDKSE
ncbi:TPA: hypothetical protein SCR51_001259 [Citrobacter freundii]|uniref:hypothetical protein n=1 Tax=Citrobacter freundii TaxID=546 RepID=UPI001A948465|nr:hypothetical protein [Citrobacter freundii]MBO0957310.1 hypothetical protein [Citrobacter freundii]MEB0937584.1 hypothetical protein [Citrobacter freundii]HCB2882995.1 hypothetical protein [Citrobacter freundii]HEG1880924.1 hypothetical protein [Citrobacter freundii]